MRKLHLQNKPIIMWATGIAGLTYLLIWVIQLASALAESYVDDISGEWFVVPWIILGPIMLAVYGLIAGLFAWLIVGLYKWSVAAVVIGAVVSTYLYTVLGFTVAGMVGGVSQNDGSQLYWLGGSLFCAVIAAYYDLKYRRPKASIGES